MTSGQFKSYPTADIFVNREARQRRHLSDIADLAESINRIGLIHPIVVRRTGELVAGERRFAAIQSLGWSHCPVQFIDELSEEELHIVELEENIRRVDITWQEECLAVEKYHQLRAAQDKTWTSEKTADALGMHRVSLYKKQLVARELQQGNERITSAPQFSTALNITQRTAERRRAVDLQSLETAEEIKDEAPILLADFNDWGRDYDGPSFNVIHCDFPYGINADKHNQGAAKTAGGYADTQEVYHELLDTLSDSMDNGIVSDSAHLIFWFSMTTHEITRKRLTQMGWRVNPWPLIWFKSDNSGILPDPARGPRQVYETAFFASRGDRKIISAVSNCCAAGVDRSVHMSAKPTAVLRHFMRMVVDGSSSVLDPTCGSANALRAALDLNANRVLGLEINEEFYEIARRKWA